jgi:hypothetical protein
MYDVETDSRIQTPNRMQVESARRRAMERPPYRKPITMGVVAWTIIAAVVFATVLYFGSW